MNAVLLFALVLAPFTLEQPCPGEPPVPASADDLWRMKTALYENWVSGGWDSSLLSSYSYDSDNRLHQVLYEAWSGGAWANSMLYTYAWNSQGLNTEILFQQWEGGWQNDQLTMNSYQGEDITEVLTMTWSGSWDNGTLSTYTYEAGKVSQILYQSWSGDNWQNEMLYSYTCQGDLTHEILTQNWNGGVWVNNTLTTNSYAGGKLDQALTKAWNGSIWVNSYLISYTYTGDQVAETLFQTWQGGSWQNYFHQGYTCDEHGNNTEVLSRTWSGGSWVNSSRVTNTWESYLGVHGGHFPGEFSDQGVLQLGGPSPNPSSGAVSFTLASSAPGQVSVTVHDLRGLRLCTLFDSSLSPGIHDLYWAGGVPPGIYLLRVMGFGENHCRRVVVLGGR